MAIDIEEIIERAFEKAFSKALDQTIQAKAEALFKEALAGGSPLAKRLEQKIEEGFNRFLRRRHPLGKEKGRVQEIICCRAENT